MSDLGFCVRRDEPVSEWACKTCFWADARLREEFRDERPPYAADRQACVFRHIEVPRRQGEREAQVVRLRPMLDQMDAGGWQGIVRNVLEAALAHPDEETAKILLRQIEAHAAFEPPEPVEDAPYCVLCGAEAEADDTACGECGGAVR